MFHFVANLKPYTFHRGRGNRRFAAYLLSADYVDDHRELASEVVSDDRVLSADNGNVDRIRALLKRFEPAASALARRRDSDERSLGRRLRPAEISRKLRDEYRALARQIRTASRKSVTAAYIRATMPRQVGMEPTYLIGMEDFTVATLTGLSMEPEYTGLPRGFYEPLVRRAVRFALKQQAGDYGPCPAHVFAGVHAIDYDTAKMAGAIAGEAGVYGIASGLVGALQDKSYAAFRIQDAQYLELQRSVPRPYVRVLEIAAGFHVGFAQATGHRLRFHALGAGSPILLPLLALLGDARTYTSADSTAPIVDGWTAPTISLYVDRPAPLKYKAYKIANHWLSTGRGWSCECPYCRAFNKMHPPKLGKARSWWKSEGKPELKRRHLHSKSPLSNWFPLLGNARNADVRRAAGMARVGHNHWVLMRIETQIRRAARERRLRRWVRDVVERYMASAAADSWKAATRVAWQIGSCATSGTSV